MSLSRRRWTRVALIQLSALLLGVVVAIGIVPDDVAASHGGYHCTKYAPSVLAPDVNCFINASFSAGFYNTPSSALRDSNSIDFTAIRCWSLGYLNSTITSSGCGYWGYLGSSQGSYRVAYCQWNGAATFGNCTTEWH